MRVAACYRCKSLIASMLMADHMKECKRTDIEWRHCDEYIDDETQPKALRDALAYYRLPASEKYPMNGPAPVQPLLYASYGGRPVQVVFASRMGDVGITNDLDPGGGGYTIRVMVGMLTDFRVTP